ncbi:MAG: TetR family transcriptional regulator, partial [Gammaproteobacteria bacterium]|nr:TetR family transcriptional regulator [Gammaproteobacteria bacterium]
MKLSAGEKTRQLILDSVLAVIAKEGVDAITHRRVGHEAGVSHGVVSYHFPTRDELIYKSF